MERTVDVHYAEIQERYGGQYVARLGGKVIAHAATYRELSEHLDRISVPWPDVVIEYVDPSTSVSVY